MRKIGTVLFLVLCISGIIVAVFSPLGIATYIAMNEASAATTTGMSPTVGPACNCVPEDISKSLMKMGQVVEQLTNELNTIKAQEADAQAALAEARAEIERLKAEKKHARRIDDVTCLGPGCVF